MNTRQGELRACAAVRGIVGLVAFVLCAISGLLTPAPAQAGAQLISFTVGNPPPPETQPVAGSSGTSASSTNTNALGGVSLAASDLQNTDPTVGTMAGQADTVGGSATYSVPIVVPPGRAGMEPSISINYNSRSGNSVVGMGWSISGLSSIHRCPQTPEQDGQTLGVKYASSDKLCLDGQRLIVTNTGAYGASGTEYHTEIDGYAKVTQFGGSIGIGDGACFKVEQKDGRILYYGGLPNGTNCTVSTVGSRVTPTGASRALSWLVERVQDRVGNVQQYSYNPISGSSGEVLVDTITYTGFVSSTGTVTAGDRTVKFNYTSRTSNDFASSYLAGFGSLQTQQLQSIVTTAAGSTVRSYTPTYSSAQYNGRLLLKSLQECGYVNGASKQCHPATTFSYNDSTLNFQLASISDATGIPEGSVNPGDPPGLPTEFSTIPDLDGDGASESVARVYKPDAIHTYLLQLTGDRKAHQYIELTGTPFTASASPQANLDGSGKSALIQMPSSDGVLSLNIWKQTRGYVFDTPSTTDFNANFNTLFQNYATNIPYTVSSGPQGQSQTLFVADMDGDGKPDVIVVQQASTAAAPTGCGPADAKGPKDGVFIYKNNISGTIAGALTSSNGFIVPTGPALCLQRTVTGSVFYEQAIDHIADFDGDGIPDFYLVYGGTDKTATTRVGGFAGIALTQPGASSTTVKTCTQIGLTDDGYNDDDDCNWQHGYVAHWMDVNGDGLEDLVFARGRTGNFGTGTATANQEKWIIRLNKGGTMGPEINTSSSAGLTTDLNAGGDHSLVNFTFRYATSLPTMDVDGDGKADVLIPDSFAVKMCKIQSVPPLGSSEGCPLADGPLGSSSTSSVTAAGQCAAWACPEDVGAITGQSNMPANTDSQSNSAFPYKWKSASSSAGTLPAYGLHDSSSAHASSADLSTYHLSMVKFVQTGDSSFTVSVVSTPIISNLSAHPNIDLFGDGLSDYLSIAGCENAPQQFTNGQLTFQSNNCSVVADTTHGPNTALGDGRLPCDTSQTSDGSCYFDIHPVLYANVNQGTSQTGGSLRPNGLPAMNVRSSPRAVSLSLGAPTIPNLLYEAVNGVGDYTKWIYYTLSFPGSQGGIPLYTVPSGSGYQDDRNFYFQSSMPVVSNMVQPTANTPSEYGFRTFAYGYDEAMYNRYGRGFLGFRQIIAEEGYDDSVNSRFLRTTTLYNQKFPLTGKVDTVTTSVPSADGSTNKLVQTDSSTYICTPSDRSRAACPNLSSQGTVYRPMVDTQTTKSYDLGTTAQYAEVDTVNATSASATTSGWDTFGNLTDQVVVHLEAGSPTFLDNTNADTTKRGHQTVTNNTYVTDSTAWWVNKLTGSTVTTNIYYDTSHAFTGNSATLSQQLNTTYEWNSDRTPLSKAVQPGTPDQQSKTVFCYPQTNATTSPPCPATTAFGTQTYGLPTRVRTCLGTYDSNGVCQADVTTDQAPERITDFTYTKDGSTSANDGYFVLTTKRTVDTTAGTAQTTTTTHQPSDGQTLVATDPNSVKVQTQYDQFGRPIQIDHLDATGAAIESTIYLAYATCLDTVTPVPNPDKCDTTLVGEATTDESNAAFRVTTVQDGYPTKATWYDLLGRAIKQGHRGFDGTFIGTATTYDNLGTVSSQSTPYFVGGAPYYTNWAYDALNRPVTKTVDDSDLTLSHAKQKTVYTYSGRTTSLTVYDSTLTLQTGNACPANASNVCLQMSRSTNALGQLMQTSELPILGTGTTTTAHTTNYWTDPLGHVVGISDPEGNTTTAVFNPLGQRTSSSDPDQGTWTFKYDALGELNYQTDARGVQLTVNKRDALGRVKEQQQVPPTSVTGLDANILFDTWSYDPANGIGELDTVTRSRGSALNTLSAVWKEQYTYETNTARLKQIDTTITEGTAVSLTSSMTYDTQGRPLTFTYPKGPNTSGLVVKNLYTDYGQLQSLTNNGTTTYWTATSANEWDHVTGETMYGSITGSHADYDSTGQASTLTWTGKDKFVYGYDSFGNLVKQIKYVGAGSTATNTETYSYDPLQRILNATRTNGGAVNYAYSKSGNITLKSDFSTGTGTPYTYGGSGCGPHGVTSVSMPNSVAATYQCDTNGNVIRGNTLTNTFNAENRLIAATRTYLQPTTNGDKIFCTGFQTPTNTCVNSPPAGGSTTWAYDSDGQRSYEHSSTGNRYYGPKGYEQIGTAAYHELGPVIVKRQSGVDTVEVVLRDRLGSTLDIIGGQGGTRSFDAFGKARNADMSDRLNGTLNLPDSIHGFTSHTHADDVALVHMNGRVFDPNLGRFLSVDPVAGLGSQRLNPYSYLINSPFAGIDPTGYDTECNAGGTDCNMTNVARMDFYPQKNGSYIGVATDNKGERITVDQIASVDKNGATHVMGITQDRVNAAGNKDPSAILGFQRIGVGATFSGSLYTNHLAASYGGGFAEHVAFGTAILLACGNSPLAGAACMAYGMGESAAHNPDGAAYIAGGMGAGARIPSAAANGEATATLQGIRSASSAEESAAVSEAAVQPETTSPATAPYVRPNGTPTKAQRDFVQGKPCVDCGEVTPRQVADHKYPLVKEYYERGKIDVQRSKSLDAVQPQCPTCSARQGAELSRYSRQQRQGLNRDDEK